MYPKHTLRLQAYRTDPKHLLELAPDLRHHYVDQGVTVSRHKHDDQWYLLVGQWGPDYNRPKLPPELRSILRKSSWRGRIDADVETAAPIRSTGLVRHLDNAQPLEDEAMGPYFWTTRKQLENRIDNYEQGRSWVARRVADATRPLRAAISYITRNYPPPPAAPVRI